MSRMPVLFVGHGSPMNALEENPCSLAWIDLGKHLQRPNAILCVSAHWFTRGTLINDTIAPRQVYDMYGFPETLYRVKYPAAGAPEYAHRVSELLGDAVKIDNSWGLDHGAWSVLRRIFPAADVPAFQLSVDALAPLESHFSIGKALSPLRDEGVLILGSGNIVHNLALVDWENEGGFRWAQDFDLYIKNAVLNRRYGDTFHLSEAGESARLAVPAPDHFAPILYTLGASGESDYISVFNEACVLGSLSMTGYLFSDNT